jgi:cell division septum initiation protein DivIVA
MATMTDHDTDELALTRREASAFDIVLRGYDREQVEERLLQWSEALADAQDERDTALNELAEARHQVENQSPALQVSDRLREILTLAEQEATQIRADAAAEVRDAVEAARNQSADIRTKSDAEIRKNTAAANNEAKRIVAEAKAHAREVLAAAEEEAKDVAVTTARTRQESLEAHDILIARQHEETEQLGEQLRQEIVALEQRRDDVREQLERLRDALGTSVGSLGRSG